MVQTGGSDNSYSEKCSSERYYEAIDFSNHCRKFYIERLKAADDIKEKIQKESDDETKKDKSSAISSAMAKLRMEMASLMDQDVSLMRQLLTLNETIEEIKQRRMYGVSKDSLRASSIDLEIKQRRMYGVSKDSLRASSIDLSDSYGSVSETDMYCNEDDDKTKSVIDKQFETVVAKQHQTVKQTTL